MYSPLEDCIRLELPIDESKLDLNSLDWVQYNPRKNINRFGCSITSLDGGTSGIPDLDSILEYNIKNNKNLHERDFSTPTKFSEPFEKFLNMFKVGRSHYIKLPAGGFFPWHRDSDPETFRIIYTIKNCTQQSLIWLEDTEVLNLNDNEWYFINTKKKHALFAFQECVFAVFNVLANNQNIKTLYNSFVIR